MLTITPIYAALLAFVYIYLSIRVIKLRRWHKVAVGHGGHQALERATRAHANFAEYVPFILLLMAMAELLNHNLSYIIHGLGLILLTGRVIHAYGISQLNEKMNFRVLGMTLTFAVLALSAGSILFTLLLSKFH